MQFNRKKPSKIIYKESKVRKILLIGAIFVSVALAYIWEESIKQVEYLYHDNKQIAVEMPLDRHGLVHCQLIHFWKDGRISIIQNYWHGIPDDNVQYLDIVNPDIWAKAVHSHHEKVNELMGK